VLRVVGEVLVQIGEAVWVLGEVVVHNAQLTEGERDKSGD